MYSKVSTTRIRTNQKNIQNIFTFFLSKKKKKRNGIIDPTNPNRKNIII